MSRIFCLNHFVSISLCLYIFVFPSQDAQDEAAAAAAAVASLGGGRGGRSSTDDDSDEDEGEGGDSNQASQTDWVALTYNLAVMLTQLGNGPNSNVGYFWAKLKHLKMRRKKPPIEASATEMGQLGEFDDLKRKY